MNVLEITYKDRLYPIGRDAPPLNSRRAKETLVAIAEDLAHEYLAGSEGPEGLEVFHFEVIDDETGLAPDDPGTPFYFVVEWPPTFDEDGEKVESRRTLYIESAAGILTATKALFAKVDPLGGRIAAVSSGDGLGFVTVLPPRPMTVASAPWTKKEA